MPQPSPEEQVHFLLNVRRLVNEGQFTATYKYAMLLALADIAVESGDDSGDALTERIAEKYITYYLRQTLPYLGPQAPGGSILQQNTDRQAAIVRYIADARREHGDSLVELQRNKAAWRTLVRRVISVFWEQPLWRLQRIGDDVLDFLYPNQEIGKRVRSIELRPGAAYCLRRFHVLQRSAAARGSSTFVK